MNIQVLYEDNHLIAAYKPAGVLSQPDKSGEPSMLEYVKAYLKEKYQKPGNVFLGLLHRLDRPVSGIMLFAKTSKGASRLSEQFRNHTIEKTYQALVCGVPRQQSGLLIDVLAKTGQKATMAINGKEAVLRYQVLVSYHNYSLLKIQLGTGRFHQIRAQLSAAGFPVMGDVKYKGQSWPDSGSIALCATNLSFYGATEDKKISLAVLIPDHWQSYLKPGALSTSGA